MKFSVMFSVSCLTIASCTYTDMNFESMSEAELAAYNEHRNISQMIVCSENAQAFSRVRRRRCVTVEKMYGSVEQAEKLGVLNSVQGYGATSGPF